MRIGQPPKQRERRGGEGLALLCFGCPLLALLALAPSPSHTPHNGRQCTRCTQARSTRFRHTVALHNLNPQNPPSRRNVTQPRGSTQIPRKRAAKGDSFHSLDRRLGPHDLRFRLAVASPLFVVLLACLLASHPASPAHHDLITLWGRDCCMMIPLFPPPLLSSSNSLCSIRPSKQ